MQWNLRALFLLIAVVALICGVVRGFWQRPWPNEKLLLDLYLVSLAAIVVSAFPAGARFRGGLTGAAIFGVAHLALVLHGGFGARTFSEAEEFVRHLYLGLALLPVAFLLSQLGMMLFWREKTDHRSP